MWPLNPASVYNRAYDVLAGNHIADALFLQWAHSTNMMHVVFTEPDAQAFYCGDWQAVAQDAVAGFRHGVGLAPHDVRLCAPFATSYSTPAPRSPNCGLVMTRDENHCR